MSEPTREDEYVRDHVLEIAQWSRREHERTFCEKHIKTYEHYRNFSIGQMDVDDPQLPIGVGLVFPMLKIVSSKLMAPWQAGDQLIDATALDEPGIPIAPVRAAYINDQIINRVPRTFSTMELVKESGVLFGRGVLKPYHRWEASRTILQRLAMMVNGMRVGSYLGWNRTKEGLRFAMDYVDPFDFWWVGTERFFERCDVCFEFQHPTEASIWRRVQSGEWMGFDPERAGGVPVDEFRQRRLDLESGSRPDMTYPAVPHRLLVTEGWVETKRRANGRPVYEQRHVEILDDKQIVKNQRLETWDGNPGYIVYEPVLDCGAPASIGMVEPVEGILLTLNDMVNIAMENARKVLESPLAVDPSALQDQETVFLGAGAVNMIRGGPSMVGPILMKDLPRSFYEMVGMMVEWAHRSVGAPDFFGGIASEETGNVGSTYRGQQLMVNLAANRLTPILTKMDHELYRPLARWIDESARQRLEKPMQVRLPHPPNPSAPFSTITPDEFGPELDFAFNVKALDQASGQKRADFIQAIALVKDIAMTGGLMAQGYTLDLYETVRMILERFDLERETDKIVKFVGARPRQVPEGGPVATPGGPTLPGRPIPPGMEPSVPLPMGNAGAETMGVG